MSVVPVLHIAHWYHLQMVLLLLRSALDECILGAQSIMAPLRCSYAFRCHSWKRRRQRRLRAALGWRMSWEQCRHRLTRTHRRWLQRKQSLRYALLPDLCQCHYVDLLTGAIPQPSHLLSIQ